MTSFLRALKQRQIIKSTIAYLVVAWLIIQVLAILFPVFNVANANLKVVIIIMTIGLPIWIALNWFYHITWDGLERRKREAYDSEAFEKKKIKLNRIIIVSLALAVVLLVINTFRLQSKIEVDNEAQASIAVLAFADMSPENEQEYFSEGISAELTTQLAKIKDLKVIDRRSSFSYKGRNIPAKQIGSELDVSHILDGNVRVYDNKIRIDVQLIKVADGSHLWLETYDRNLDDIFKIQNEIAAQIIKQLQLVLGTSRKNITDRRPTNNLEAYKLYLEGLYYFNLSRVDHIVKAISFLEEAVALDQDFALAKALLSQAYTIHNVFVEFNEDWERKAYVAFEEALFIDPELAEAYVARGQWHWTPANNFNHERALLDFKRALELNPGLSSVYESLMLVQLHVGLFDKAIENGKKGVKIEPTNVWIRHFLSEIYFFKGDYDNALKENDLIAGKFDTPFRAALMAQLHVFQDQLNEAETLLQKWLINHPLEPHLNSAYALVLAKKDDFEKANSRMNMAIENEESLRHVHHLYHNLAGVMSVMGQKQEAIIWLQKAADYGLPNYQLFDLDPNLQALKGVPEFDEFMKDLKSKQDRFDAL